MGFELISEDKALGLVNSKLGKISPAKPQPLPQPSWRSFSHLTSLESRF